MTKQADTWAWGCTMVHMLSGMLPWAGLSLGQIFNQVGTRGVYPLPTLELCTGCGAGRHGLMQPHGGGRWLARETKGIMWCCDSDCHLAYELRLFKLDR